MTIRLVCGPDPVLFVMPEYERITWAEIKTQVLQCPDKNKPNYIKNPDNFMPLCGVDWLENNTHIVPVYTIYIEHGGVRHNMTIKDPSIMR